MTLNIVSSFNGVSDPDAAAYIEAVEAADGELLEFAVGKAINDFVLGCKADGIWDAIKASCILAGARTLNGALVPLAGAAPTNNNFVAGDYNRKTGLVGDGSTKYLDSGRNNNADPQNNKHVSVFVSVGETRSTTQAALSSRDAVSGAGSTELLSTTTDRFFRINRSAALLSIPTTAPIYGLLAGARNNSSNCLARFNGNTQTLNDFSSTPTPNRIDLYARNNNNYFNGRIAFYSIGEALDLALLDSRVSALITAFGAAIP